MTASRAKNKTEMSIGMMELRHQSAVNCAPLLPGFPGFLRAGLLPALLAFLAA